VQVRVREMDVEMLFSRRPFVGISGDIGAAKFVVPRHRVEVVPDASGTTILDLRKLLPGVHRSIAVVLCACVCILNPFSRLHPFDASGCIHACMRHETVPHSPHGTTTS
jgi:hypothetical protein